ncbi:hypothetical protein [Pontibacter sp. G13]|uniref:hypothetical protein n=1 Tax=Pontibacter sp. G13 TaxID=3074898 RepID=UPI00288C07BE|nr:hypothetical protein [Pontibacter sp. G13]WNJ17705.1 hypothetical protein RJD25_22870 [Pontibacter sp. G13]
MLKNLKDGPECWGFIQNLRRNECIVPQEILNRPPSPVVPAMAVQDDMIRLDCRLHPCVMLKNLKDGPECWGFIQNLGRNEYIVPKEILNRPPSPVATAMAVQDDMIRPDCRLLPCVMLKNLKDGPECWGFIQNLGRKVCLVPKEILNRPPAPVAPAMAVQDDMIRLDCRLLPCVMLKNLKDGPEYWGFIQNLGRKVCLVPQEILNRPPSPVATAMAVQDDMIRPDCRLHPCVILKNLKDGPECWGFIQNLGRKVCLVPQEILSRPPLPVAPAMAVQDDMIRLDCRLHPCVILKNLKDGPEYWGFIQNLGRNECIVPQEILNRPPSPVAPAMAVQDDMIRPN